MTNIGNSAFSGCSSLTSIFCLGIIPPTIAKSTFGRDAYNFADLFVPQGTKDAYQAATGWKEFLTIKEFDPMGIDQLTIGKSQLTIYDLKGRKVTDTESLKGGIYIVNGKKVVIE